MSTLDLVKSEINNCGRSKKEIAAGLKIPYTTLCSLLGNNKKSPRIEWDLVCKVADYFGRDLEFFRGQEPEKATNAVLTDVIELLQNAIETAGNKGKFKVNSPEITCDVFLSWWEQHKGRLENFDRIAPHVDLFSPPENDSALIQPIKSGPSSLASVCFNVESSEQLTHTLQGFSAPLNRDLVGAHLEALHRGFPVLSYQSISERLPDGSLFVGEYRRILAPVSDGNKTMVANFSQESPNSPIGRFHRGSEPSYFQSQQ